MWNERRAREALLVTVSDVRMDGTMASISGTDAPNILITKSLQQYIEQTHDLSVLMEERSYFDDANHSFTHETCKGTILEHLLVLHLVSFFEEIEREKKGEAEQVPPMERRQDEFAECLECVAGWLQELLDKQGIRHLEVAVELDVLLAHREDLLESIEYKKNVLIDYRKSVDEKRVGIKTHLPTKMIIDSLLSKANYLQGKEEKDEL